MGFKVPKSVASVAKAVTAPITAPVKAVQNFVTPPKASTSIKPSGKISLSGGGILGAANKSIAATVAPVKKAVTDPVGTAKAVVKNPIGEATKVVTAPVKPLIAAVQAPVADLTGSITRKNVAATTATPSVSTLGKTPIDVATNVATTSTNVMAPGISNAISAVKTPDLLEKAKDVQSTISTGGISNAISPSKKDNSPESVQSAWAGFKDFSENLPTPKLKSLDNISLPENMQVSPVEVTAGRLSRPENIKAPERKYTGFSGGENLKALGELGRGETSPWEKLALEKQDLEQKSAIDAAARQSAGSAAGARASLAMRGGLGSGAATSLAKAQMAQQNMGQSSAMQQGALERLGIKSEAAKQRQSALSTASDLESNIGMTEAERSLKGGMADVGTALDVAKTNTATGLDVNRFNINTGLDVAKTNAAQNMASQQFNVGNTLGEASAQRNFDLDIFKQKMAGYGAEKTAQGLAKGGKK
jgi:hypothetical protein